MLKQPDPPSTRMSLDAVNENQVEGQTLVPSTKLSVLHAEHMLVTDRAEVHVAQEQEHYSRSLPAADTPDAELNNSKYSLHCSAILADNMLGSQNRL